MSPLGAPAPNGRSAGRTMPTPGWVDRRGVERERAERVATASDWVGRDWADPGWTRPEWTDPDWVGPAGIDVTTLRAAGRRAPTAPRPIRLMSAGSDPGRGGPVAGWTFGDRRRSDRGRAIGERLAMRRPRSTMRRPSLRQPSLRRPSLRHSTRGGAAVTARRTARPVPRTAHLRKGTGHQGAGHQGMDHQARLTTATYSRGERADLQATATSPLGRSSELRRPPSRAWDPTAFPSSPAQTSIPAMLSRQSFSMANVATCGRAHLSLRAPTPRADKRTPARVASFAKGRHANARR